MKFFKELSKSSKILILFLTLIILISIGIIVGSTFDSAANVPATENVVPPPNSFSGFN